MNLWSLQDLSVKQIVANTSEGSVPCIFPVSKDLSNEIFKKLIADGCGEKFDASNLNVTKVHFKSVFMTMNHLKAISKFALTTLELGDNAFEYDLDYGRPTLSQFLCDNLVSSWETLTHFRLPRISFGHLEEELKTFLTNFKNVHRLDLSATYITRFPRLDNEYFKVTYLDISGSYMSNLRGISMFPCLTELVMYEMKFESDFDIDDIFFCENLKIISVSSWPDSSNFVALFAEHKKTLSALEVLDCSNTEADEVSIRKLLTTHHHLQCIILYKTPADEIELDGIRVVNGKTLESAVKLLDHYKDTKNSDIKDYLLDDILEMWNPNVEFETHEKSIRCVLDILLVFVGNFHKIAYGGLNTSAILSVIRICELYSQHLSNEKKREIVSVMMQNEHENNLAWTILRQPQIANTPGLDYFSLYQKVIDYYCNVFHMLYRESRLIPVLNILHHLVPYEKRYKIQGNKKCIEQFLRMLSELCNDFWENDRDYIQVGEQIESTLDNLMNASNEVFTVFHVLDILDFVERCEIPFINSLLLKATGGIILRLKIGQVRAIAENTDFVKLLKGLLGDLMTPHRGTIWHYEHDVAVFSLRIIATLAGFLNQEELALSAKLREIAENLQYTYYYIPIWFVNELTGEEEHYVYGSVSLDTWIEKMDEEMKRLIEETATKNNNLFESNTTDGTLWEHRNIQGKLLYEDHDEEDYIPLF